MQARFPEGTFGRITAVLRTTEDRTEFVRAAVENELRRREASSSIDHKTDDAMRKKPAKSATGTDKRKKAAPN